MAAIALRRQRIDLGLLALEPRWMFDGAAVADAAHAVPDAAAKALIPNVPMPVEVRAADPSKDNGKKEVVFVDTSVADYKTLEAAIKLARDNYGGRSATIRMTGMRHRRVAPIPLSQASIAQQ